MALGAAPSASTRRTEQPGAPFLLVPTVASPGHTAGGARGSSRCCCHAGCWPPPVTLNPFSCSPYSHVVVLGEYDLSNPQGVQVKTVARVRHGLMWPWSWAVLLLRDRGPGVGLQLCPSAGQG